MRMKIACFSICAMAGLLGGLLSPAVAEILVLKSNVPSVPADVSLDAYQLLRLSAGDVLQVFDTETGETKTLKGPFEGTAATYQDPCAAALGCTASEQGAVGGVRGTTGK
jgi:hypothetical protein